MNGFGLADWHEESSAEQQAAGKGGEDCGARQSFSAGSLYNFSSRPSCPNTVDDANAAVCERGAFTAWSISVFSALTLLTQDI